MRWYIEVSRIGEAASAEQYCVEAKQWQGALQEARRLRGDSGPLSKFSIELLDSGYRAVDPRMNIRYLVHRAPRDAPLSEGGRSIPSQLPPERTSSPPRAPTRNSGSNDLRMSEPPRPERSKPGASRPKQSRPDLKPIQASAIVEIGDGLRVPNDPVPPSAESSAAAAAKPVAGASNSGASSARFEVIRKREEEPTAATPITYREYAYRVERGTARSAVEALLWNCFREISSVLEARPKGKFIQLAVFDHVFEGHPLAPALATLSWKDWRGEPVLEFPAFTHVTLPDPSASSLPAAGPAAFLAAPAQAVPPAQIESDIAAALELG
ncbi:MAG TPA: hypothetical protein VK524_19085, partial [Polyangiaceae bacterium]|nr:hypothetical protein [Polyangiaceae bacterium]